MNRLLQHLAAGLPEPDVDGLTDGQLLEAYLARRDSTLFAALVRRHAPMVWGVCRRLLPCHQDAEDAFQATFLVLVRRAAAVVPRHMVGNWLYGVACQTALKARALAARRHARERQGADMPEPEATPMEASTDLQPVLDEELARLPDRYRSVLILCDLEGKTRREAAGQLGVPDGTVAGWLARARAMLAKRLTRRGITLSGTALAAALTDTAAPATVPPALLTSTIHAAAVFAAVPVNPGAVPAPVLTLTEGVLKAMLLKKLKAAVLVLAAAAVLGTGLTGLAFRASAGEQGPKHKAPAGPTVEKAPAGANDELRSLRAEITRLRAEVEAMKKQMPPAEPDVRLTPERPADAAPKLVTRVYPVRDLLGVEVGEEPAAPLLRIISTGVHPESWNMQGGPGSVEYFPAGKSLVVRQTAAVHEELMALLEALRSAASVEEPTKKETDPRLRGIRDSKR
jgi:RNA polymerase sigma factor (sigma-70 family)